MPINSTSGRTMAATLHLNFDTTYMLLRWTAFLKVADNYKAHVTTRIGRRKERVLVDYGSLRHVFVSTYYDIHRYKTMHLEDPRKQLSDSVKRSAYYVKWIVRMRPFFLDRKTYEPNKNDYGVYLNEDFALRWAYSNLKFELTYSQALGANGTSASTKQRRFIPPTSKMYGEFLYDLRYRSLSSDALIHIFQDYINLCSAPESYFDMARRT